MCLLLLDKANNITRSNDHYQKFLHDKITKIYQKAPPKLDASINWKQKSYLLS